MRDGVQYPHISRHRTFREDAARAFLTAVALIILETIVAGIVGR